jgi:hypothetical protein
MTTSFSRRKAETPAPTEISAYRKPVIDGNFGLRERQVDGKLHARSDEEWSQNGPMLGTRVRQAKKDRRG